MNKIESMKKLMELTGANPVDFSVKKYKNLFEMKEKKYEEKKVQNCMMQDCKKIIVKFSDLKFYYKYMLCEDCYLKTTEGK